MIFMSPNFVVNCNAITKCTLPRGGARFQRFHWIEEVDHPLLPFPLEAKATVQTHQKLSRIISPVASSYLTLLKRPTHCGKSQFLTVRENLARSYKFENCCSAAAAATFVEFINLMNFVVKIQFIKLLNSSCYS